MLLAIDPGTDWGWADFGANGQLRQCGMQTYPPYYLMPKQADLAVVVEIPRIYPGGRTANPNDVLLLAVKAGEWVGRYQQYGRTRYVEPAEWKGGQVKKEIQHARDWARLTDAEKAIVDAAGRGMAPSKRHNMLDAIGIGLFALGRGYRKTVLT